jgi:hypothetical protein
MGPIDATNRLWIGVHIPNSPTVIRLITKEAWHGGECVGYSIFYLMSEERIF